MESKNVLQQILGGNIWGANFFSVKKKFFFLVGGAKWGTISFKSKFS